MGSRTSPAGEIGLSMLTVTQLRLAKSASASALACGAGLFTRRAELVVGFRLQLEAARQLSNFQAKQLGFRKVLCNRAKF